MRDRMVQRPDVCNSAQMTKATCPECYDLGQHALEYIRCVKVAQAQTLEADGSGEVDAGRLQAAVSGVHYPTIFVPRTEGRDFAATAPAFDAYVGNSLIHDGHWMLHEVKLLKWLTQPGDVIVDAGANIGGFTMPLAKHVGPNGQVHAFEPFRLIFQCLNANVMLNGLSNVYTYQVGLSNRSEAFKKRQPDFNAISNPSKMHIPAQVASELMVRWDARPNAFDTVQVMRLDEVNFGKRGPSMIKVDVESMELPMIQGATRTIKRYRPNLFIEDSEFDGSSGMQNPTRLMKYLYALDYLAVDLIQSGFTDATSMLFVPAERKREVLERLYSIDFN